MKVRNEKYKNVNLQQILVCVNKDYVRQKAVYFIFIYLFIFSGVFTFIISRINVTCVSIKFYCPIVRSTLHV